MLLKEFIQVNGNTDIMIESAKDEDDLKNISVCVVTRIKKKIFDENSKKPFVKTYTFSNHDTNKFMILLQIVVYPNE